MPTETAPLQSQQSAQTPLVSIIIPTFNKWDFTWKCLMAVAQNTRDVAHEVIVVDNASSDDTAQALPLLEDIRVQYNQKNLGFARASNQGAAMARGKYLMFLNNDTEPRAGWLSAMVKVADADPRVAMVGAKLLFPDGTIQHGGVVFGYGAPLPIAPFHLHYRHPASTSTQVLSLRAVTAACMLIRPEVFRAMGGFDEGFVNGYEDIDLCLKVWKTGAKIIYTPDAVVVHHESKSEGRFLYNGTNTDRLNRRWTRDFDSFDLDMRREVQPLAVDPRRAGTSVIVPMYDALWSLVPCLENLRVTTGAQDEIIIVDDGSPGAISEFASLFASRHPDRVRLIRNPSPVGMSQAARQGLEAATRSRVAVLAPSLRVVGDWAVRLSRHLDSVPGLGVVTPALLPVEHLPVNELMFPVGRTAPDVAPPGPAAVEAIRFPDAQMYYGERERLLALVRDTPEVLFGDDQAALAGALERQGLSLGRATDVGVLRLTQLPGDTDPQLVARYVAQESANLRYERRYQGPGGAAVGTITAAQTELTSLVIVAHDNLAVTAACLDSIYAHTHRSFEIVLVDNGSREPLRALATDVRARRGNLTYLRNERNEGYARACNQGLAAARGEYVGILHDDVVVSPGWLGRLLAVMAIDPAVALAGPALSASGTVQTAEIRTYSETSELPAFARDWGVNHRGEIAMLSPLSGVCLLMRRQVLARIGGLDPTFTSSSHADDDFCLRAHRAGFRMAVSFGAFVHHHGAATYKRLGLDRKRVAAEAWESFRKKWGLREDATLLPAFRELAAQPFDPARDRIPLPEDDEPSATAAEPRLQSIG